MINGNVNIYFYRGHIQTLESIDHIVLDKSNKSGLAVIFVHLILKLR